MWSKEPELAADFTRVPAATNPAKADGVTRQALRLTAPVVESAVPCRLNIHWLIRGDRFTRNMCQCFLLLLRTVPFTFLDEMLSTSFQVCPESSILGSKVASRPPSRSQARCRWERGSAFRFRFFVTESPQDEQGNEGADGAEGGAAEADEGRG
jgi:hypothetical protein